MSRLTQMEYEIDFGIVSSRRLRGDQVNNVETWQIIVISRNPERCLGIFDRTPFWSTAPGHPSCTRAGIGFEKLFPGGETLHFLHFLSPSFPARSQQNSIPAFSIFSPWDLEHWPPKANQFQSLYGIWITRKVSCFETQTNIEFPSFLPSKYETLRTLHKFSGSDKIACSHRNEKCSL